MTDFVHLSLHTEYSLVDGTVRVKPLLDAARELEMPAVAVTDQGNVSAMVKLYRAAVDRGIKPVIGADVWVAQSEADKDPACLRLLCARLEGYRNLSRLLTESYSRARVQGRALILKEWLSDESLDGLIGLSGGQKGEIGRVLAGSHAERVGEVLESWCRVLPDRFYIELHRVGRPGEADYNAQAVALAAAHGVPVVATNDVRFLGKDDFYAHEARVCIAQGRTLDDPDRTRAYTQEQYLKSNDEMRQLFEELPEALDNSTEIAMRCNLEVDLGNVYLPNFELKEQTTAQAHLSECAKVGLAQRMTRMGISAADEPQYHERLKLELDVICQMGFEGYFLIVADFIEWSKNQAIPVGPGRGSGAGSLVAFVLGITNLDPIEHELLFERFLNPERVSMPDFDIDFCIEGRDRVIEYVAQRYGKDHVSQIITYGTMAARAVVRDVGRVLGMPYGYIDRIAKLIPFEVGMTLHKAMDSEAELLELYEREDDIQALIDMAMQLEGLARNVGTHAGGVVIAPNALTNFVPLYCEQDGALLTQLDKDDLEAIGLVKFDFLGLKTLTILDKATQSINEQRSASGESPIDLDTLQVDDPATYALLNRGETTAVFQLESRGMRDLVKRLQPDCFDDLVAVLALYRPGPLQTGMVDDFIARKHGTNTSAIDYLHPSLEAVLKPTYGVILYQEQVMQIAQILAGYSLGGADLLRRAMGKKKPEEMAEQRSVFVNGARSLQVEPGLAQRIFDLMEKFAGYGFNKSHSAAYALIAYQTAWLKAHYPAAFMAAAMSADIDNTDKLVVLKDDCSVLGIELTPPDVNKSTLEFAVEDPTRIIYGLGAIKGVGRSAAEAIVGARESDGPFNNLLDLCRRVGLHKLNRRALEALVRCGALDGLDMNRATALHAIPSALRLTERLLSASASGQGMLFGSEGGGGELEHEFDQIREWSAREKLEAERESLGLYLTGHPFSDVAAHCRHFSNGAIANVLRALPDGGGYFKFRKEATLAGVVMDVRRRGSRVTIVLDDDTERIEVSLFEEVYNSAKHLISKHTILVIDGQLRYDDFINDWCLTAQRVRTVDAAIEEHARRLTICVGTEDAGSGFIGTLQDTLRPFVQGRCEVCLQFRGLDAQAEITLSDEWAVHPTRELREQLAHWLGDESFSLHYAKHLVHR